MSIQVHKVNLETIIRAAKAGRLAIVDCQDKATRKAVTILCAIGQDRDVCVIVPFAKLFDSNPYEELYPPNLDGGSHAD